MNFCNLVQFQWVKTSSLTGIVQSMINVSALGCPPVWHVGQRPRLDHACRHCHCHVLCKPSSAWMRYESEKCLPESCATLFAVMSAIVSMPLRHRLYKIYPVSTHRTPLLHGSPCARRRLLAALNGNFPRCPLFLLCGCERAEE